MARTGIEYQDVAEAAQEILRENLPLTIEQVRVRLGTGSFSTVSKYLNQFKDLLQPHSSAADNLPPELISFTKGLWSNLVQQVDLKVERLTKQHTDTLATLNHDLEKYKENNRRWQQLHEQWNREKAQLLLTGKSLESTLFQAQKESDNLQVKNNILLIQINEKEKQILELQKLHQQTQKNLEHYREAALEQRLLDEERNKQQRMHSEVINRELKQELFKAKEREALLLQKYESERNDKSGLQNLNNQLYQELDRLKQLLPLTEKELNESHRVTTHLQTQVAVLAQQLATSNRDMNELKERIHFVTAEKIQIIQERAQLEEKLKHANKRENIT
jgi:chromosome segregation ATPase